MHKTITRFRKHFVLFNLFASIGAWADPLSPTLPSDADIGAAMQKQRIETDKTLATAVQSGALPSKVLPKASDLSVPAFMQQKGFGGVMPLAQSVAQRLTQQGKQNRTLMIAVTLSMPEERLSDYAKQAKEAGAVLVLRGVPENNTLPQAEVRIARINNGVGATWNIDPTIFRKFKINHVPAAILVDDYSASKMESSCAPDVSYLRVDGDISIRQALTIMAREKSDLGSLAQARLTGIETSGARAFHE